MLLLKFRNIESFENYYNSSDWYVRDKCSCGGIREMQLLDCKVTIGDYEIYLKECPILVCQKCEKEKLGNRVPWALYYCYFDMEKANAKKCKLTALNKERFNFAESKKFIYDYRDLNIPGLDIDLDPTHSEGFSCPVFFNKMVLNNFLFDTDYDLDLFSESQGQIGKKGTNGFIWEWLISFGINTNGKVVMFLGDLDQIEDDDKAVLWLKSYNIESDHTLVNSELYRSELKCEFSDPIIEQQLIQLRNSFFDKIKRMEKLDLFHLEEAVEQKSKDLKKPINFTKEEFKNNVVLLDNLLNDAINQSNLQEFYKRRVKLLPKDFKNMKTIKLLLGILSTNLSNEKANDLLSPLFNLKDLRDYYSHILPTSKASQIKERIISSYYLGSFEEYEKMYNILLNRLLKLYKYLNFAEI